MGIRTWLPVGIQPIHARSGTDGAREGHGAVDVACRRQPFAPQTIITTPGAVSALRSWNIPSAPALICQRPHRLSLRLYSFGFMAWQGCAALLLCALLPPCLRTNPRGVLHGARVTQHKGSQFLSPSVTLRYHTVMVAGELRQLTGSNGLERARRWLHYSTRVATSYTNTDKVFRDLLHFEWPYGDQEFSFDLGGKFRGGEFNDKSFMAEVKAYKYEMDSPKEYRGFIAECYVAFQEKPDRCDNLLWLSWAPFQAQMWHKHRSPEYLRKHLLHNDNIFRVFGTDSLDDAKGQIDEQVIFEISKRLWLLTLCEEQEDLVIMSDHYKELMAFMGVEEGSW